MNFHVVIESYILLVFILSLLIFISCLEYWFVLLLLSHYLCWFFSELGLLFFCLHAGFRPLAASNKGHEHIHTWSILLSCQ
jgi:hypothetical protein